MSKSTKQARIEPFPVDPNSPFAEEEKVVSQMIEASIGQLRDINTSFYQNVELKNMLFGDTLLAAKPPEARRYVMAALAQVVYWERLSIELRKDSSQHTHQIPEWPAVWGRRRRAETVIRTLMRKKLPFEKADLIALIGWANSSDYLSQHTTPINPMIKAVENYAASNPIDDELKEAVSEFAMKLRLSHYNELKPLGTRLEQLLPKADVVPASEATGEAAAVLKQPQPGPVGQPGVLTALKKALKLLPAEIQPNVETELVGVDQYPLAVDSPLKTEHELLNEIIEKESNSGRNYYTDLDKVFESFDLSKLDPEQRGRLLIASCERAAHVRMFSSVNYDNINAWRATMAAMGLPVYFVRRQFKLDRDNTFDLFLYLSTLPDFELNAAMNKWQHLVTTFEKFTAEQPLTEGERYVLHLCRSAVIKGPLLGKLAPVVEQLGQLIGDNASYYLAPGEFWADTLNGDVSSRPPAEREAWRELLAHTLTATSSKPSKKWLTTAMNLVKAVGSDQFRSCLDRWLSLVPKGNSVLKIRRNLHESRGVTEVIHQENANSLRGMLWIIPELPDAEKFGRLVTGVALSAYKKVPGVGPRAVKVGNAAIYCLSQLPAGESVGQLAMLKVRVKFGTAQKEIEKAFNVAAASLNLPREEIEEMGVPSYGLEAGGTRKEEFGDYTAELRVTGSNAKLHWFDAKGKELKTVPTKVKKEHGEDFKDLTQSVKDIQGMLPAQRDRIDSLFLQQKSWPIATWRERYLDHPLVGTIASRLIWCVDEVPVIFVDGQPVDVRGQPLEHGQTAEVTLWHPVGRSIEEITQWRQRLEELGVVQPFKQAHREVYLLTDAERRTRVYSNRYAAHVIRQHQFNALCAARGWKNQLRLMVDDSYNPPYRSLPLWNLRAEFWVEGIGEDYGNDTNESGTYLRLTTDQVRFYRLGAAENYAHAGGGGYENSAAGAGTNDINEPVPMEEIPELVFSEIMRDVDLFVGVASVGNDPTWQDGGPEGRYREYWHTYSFGELSGTATTRKQVLERLLPRLKIAKKCKLTDRFLVVEGELRTYKIHLGSGNILMEPNDQYLCIVADAKTKTKQADVFLPFEGDNMMSIILSKAFLLADDKKIKDTTITSQINRR